MRNDDGFLLALLPTADHHSLPDGVHIGFGLDSTAAVLGLRAELFEMGVRVSELEDCRPDEQHVSFRCWDPDDTEIEVFWQVL